jgi:hypothetical protein
MIVRDKESLSSQLLTLPTPVTDKAQDPAEICSVVGTTGKGFASLTIDHSFSVLKINVNP